MTTAINVTFLKDHQSYHSGHEFYPAGAKATLTGGRTLVNQGVAREGWGPPPEPEPVLAVDLDGLTVKELRQMAKEQGHMGYSPLKKELLVKMLRAD